MHPVGGGGGGGMDKIGSGSARPSVLHDPGSGEVVFSVDVINGRG